MTISAHVRNGSGEHQVTLCTNGQAHDLSLAPKPGGGSSVNGGELLFLALATCYCNDVYREAAKRGIAVTHVEVFVEGEFAAEGAAARNVSYRTKVTAKGTEAEIRALVEHTDRVAEIQNTLRSGVPVALSSVEVVSVAPESEDPNLPSQPDAGSPPSAAGSPASDSSASRDPRG